MVFEVSFHIRIVSCIWGEFGALLEGKWGRLGGYHTCKALLRLFSMAGKHHSIVCPIADTVYDNTLNKN